jgi:hypothetical protein
MRMEMGMKTWLFGELKDSEGNATGSLELVKDTSLVQV